jgi:hypothetical protein
MQFNRLLLAYFMIGAVMWGGGAIDYGSAGVSQMFVEQNATTGEYVINEETRVNLQNSGGPIQTAASGLAGGLIAIWNLIVTALGFLFWPITTLQGVNAPPRVVVLLGGAPTVAFWGSIILLFANR